MPPCAPDTEVTPVDWHSLPAKMAPTARVYSVRKWEGATGRLGMSKLPDEHTHQRRARMSA